MELNRALAQVAAIQDQLTRADVYRGYRSLPVAASGAIGLVAARPIRSGSSSIGRRSPRVPGSWA
jgi:hypothetical protein